MDNVQQNHSHPLHCAQRQTVQIRFDMIFRNEFFTKKADNAFPFSTKLESVDVISLLFKF